MTALNKINKSWKKTIKAISLTTSMSILCPGLAIADPNVVFGTNWFAEAQHGGYYEAVATGLYKKFGLNVKIDMGGPEINGEQLLAAGKYQFYMGNGVDQLIASPGHKILMLVVNDIALIVFFQDLLILFNAVIIFLLNLSHDC